MADRQVPEQAETAKVAEAGARADGVERADVGAGPVPSIARLQRDAGNAATAAWVQRDKDPSAWKKVAPKKGLPSSPITMGSAPAAPKVTSWKKSAPGVGGPSGAGGRWGRPSPPGSAPPAAKVIGGARDVAVIAKAAVEAAVAAGDKATTLIALGAKQVEGGVATAKGAVSEVAGAVPVAQKSLAAAKGKWSSEAHGAGCAAANEASAITSLWTKADAHRATTAAGAKRVVQGRTEVDLGVKEIGAARTRLQTAVAKLPLDLSPAGQVRAAASVHSAKLANALTKAKVVAGEAAVAARTVKQAEVDRAAKQGEIKKVDATAWAPLTPGGGPEVIIGRLQQQLNATRPPGAPRVSITAEFSPSTAAALKAYQGATASGFADALTWAKLDKAAPAVQQAGQWVVATPDGGKIQGTPFKGQAGLDGMSRPWVLPKVTAAEAWYAVDAGPAVVEVQQRLNHWYFSQIKARPVPVTGKYDAATGTALKEFQKKNKLAENGKVSASVWTALDQARGAVTEGLVQHNDVAEGEGQDRGQTIRYGWKVAAKELTITVRMKFVEVDPLSLELTDPTLKKDPANPKKVDASEVPKLRAGMQSAVTRWVSDIDRLWNGFAAKDATPGSKQDAVRITFVPQVVTGEGDATINVVPGAHAKNPTGRSNAVDWFSSDTSASMGPHEFGHLVGLPDEYSRREEHFVETTGTEAQIGPVNAPKLKGSARDHAIYLAIKVAGAAPAPDVADPGDKAKKKAVAEVRGRINAFDGAIRDLGLDTMRDWWNSAFSRAISEHFATDAKCVPLSKGQSVVEYFVNLVKGVPLDRGVQAEREVVRALQGKYSAPLHPFLSTNDTLMGNGDSVPATGAPKPTIGHDHPVQPRHLSPFLKHISAAMGGTWKLP